MNYPDFWGDSYHHYYITEITYENNFIYSDYKSNQYLWLPGFHYLGLIPSVLLGSTSLDVLHLFNILISVMSIVLVTDVAKILSKSRLSAFITGLAIALSPWHIMYSKMFMPEPWAGLCLLLLIRGLITRSDIQLLSGWGLGLVSRYENWFFGVLLLIGFYMFKRNREGKLKVIIYLCLILGGWLLLWSLWSRLGVGYGTYWINTQLEALKWDSTFYNSGINVFTLYSSWIGYGLGFVGGILLLTLFGVRRYNETFLNYNLPPALNLLDENCEEVYFLLVFLGVSLCKLISTYISGVIPSYNPRFVLIDLYLIVLLIPSWHLLFRILIQFLKEKSTLNTKLDLNRIFVINPVSILIGIIITGAFLNQVSLFSTQSYIVEPERQAGLFIKSWVSENVPIDEKVNIFVDSPVISYYGNLESDQMVSSEKYARFLNKNIDPNLRLIVLHNVSYSKGYETFSFLRDLPVNLTVESSHFLKVYEYTGWELEYGAASVTIYSVE